jgi:hypothetical protein
MDQRRLRLGDILDDYCPRERRVTNHAVVAMIEDEVRQTRCTTCDAEHVYKGARVPRRRKKEAPGALYQEVLAGIPESEVPTPLSAAIPGAAEVPESIEEAPAPAASIDTTPVRDDDSDMAGEEPDHGLDEELPPPSPVEDGPVHRQLLRAKLPRPEGQKDARPLPEFTVRQSGGRGNGSFRGDRSRMRNGSGDPRSMMGRGNGGGPASGNRTPGGGRFQGRPGQHRNPGGRGGSQSPFRGGQPRHGGKKGRG